MIKNSYKYFENLKTNILIKYIGETAVKNRRNKVKLFEVYVDGIKIEKEPFKLISENDLSRFF
jgi:hypothetical protein